MNVLLPYADFYESIKCFDRATLMSQRLEAWQLLQITVGFKWSVNMKEPDSLAHTGWTKHPAVIMWTGHSRHLAAYIAMCCDIWTDLYGFKDTVKERLDALDTFFNLPTECEEPEWLGDHAFHLSHQSNLVQKNPDHYRKFFPSVPSNLEYVWPCTIASTIPRGP